MHNQWRHKHFYFAKTKAKTAGQTGDAATGQTGDGATAAATETEVPYSKLSETGNSHHAGLTHKY